MAPVRVRTLSLALAVLCAACGEGGPPPPVEFSVPAPVTLEGYGADAMEPFLSPDGTVLFFNDSNAPGANTNLHWATRLDDLTFHYEGPLNGANSVDLDAVASLTESGELFFISLREYASTRVTLFRGQYAAGTVTAVTPITGLAPAAANTLVFDAAISADGETLYLADGEFSGGALPEAADLAFAGRAGDTFLRRDSETVLERVNTSDLEYAPCLSSDGKELYFTRATSDGTELHRATRTTSIGAFARSERIDTITSTSAEAPTLSPDARAVYFHQRADDGRFAIYRVAKLP